ncbi:MAG: DEAD/DEAH box helicase [Dehalococcoidia bacterium]|nr:DEAD/DEAH box helicase [Dehalococcoidia bacterium]
MPFPVQVMCIPDALAGRDVSGKAQTGSGKTLAFGLPLVERTKTSRKRRPRSLVLVPTRELANQITDAIAPLAAARGLWIAPIYGGVSMVRQINALRAGVDIVVATPGRLNDLLERDELALTDVSMVVLDEADQMADMGFLPQVEHILDRIEGHAQTLLFSATLDGQIGALVRKYQQDPVRYEVVSDETMVDTLEQRFIGVRADDKVEVAAQISRHAHRALMFVRTTHGADRLVQQLERAGVEAIAIHGRLTQNKRERALAAFSRGAFKVMVATNVAARGLHIEGIDVVIHFDPPEDEKNYLHRSGRTARAGEDGMVVTLVQPEQEREVTQIERAAGLDYTIVPMRSDDARLQNLGAWTPPRGLPAAMRGPVFTGRSRSDGARGRGAPSRAPRRYSR